MEATTAARTIFVALVVFRILRMSMLLWSRSYRPDLLPGSQRIVGAPMKPGICVVCTSYQSESPERGGPPSDGDRGVAGAHLVDEARQAVGELLVLQLEHVLGVQLA